MNAPLLAPKEFFEIENLLSAYAHKGHAGRPAALRKALTHPGRPQRSLAAIGNELTSMLAVQRKAQQAEHETLQKAIAGANGKIHSLIGKIPAHQIANLDFQLRNIVARAGQG